MKVYWNFVNARYTIYVKSVKIPLVIHLSKVEAVLMIIYHSVKTIHLDYDSHSTSRCAIGSAFLFMER